MKRTVMAQKDLSKYQKNVISGYYNNLDTIMLGKLSELVTELYLAETDKKKARLWQRAEKAMVNMKIPRQLIDHIIEQASPEILAKNLSDWQKRK